MPYPPVPPRAPSLWLVGLILLILGALALRGAPVSADAIKRHLVEWEGYSLVPYRDGPGWSAGIGHSLTMHGHPVRSRYTAAQVDRWFREDVSWALDACRRGIERFDDLPHDVQIVCVGIAFGVGRTGFDRFRNLRLALSYRAYRSAASELRLSRWATQVSPVRRDYYVSVLHRYSL